MLSRTLLLSITAIFLLSPVSANIPTGLTYMDSTWSSSEEDSGSLLALNSNNTILASVHNDDVILFNANTLEKLATFNFDKVSAIEFSPNGSTLAVNKAASVQVKESIKLIDVHSLTIRTNSALADDRATDIAWSPSGDVLAAPGPEGDVELYRYEDLSIKTTLHGVHNVDVTCIDYRSDGEYLITGDESGRYAIWNSQGVRQNEYREFGNELVDCKFSPDGQDIILLDAKGKLMSRTFSGSENHQVTIDGAKKVMFSDIATRMQVAVESDDFRGLLTYDYDTFEEIKRTTFFHKVEDLEYVDDEFGRLQTLFVSGGTGEVAVYQRESIPEGFNQPGADLDGDTIPDNLDLDDDGDGIIDEWDNDIGCDAPPETPCSRYPAISKIRQVTIDIGDSFEISDSITLPTEYSSHIRNLSRIAIAADQILSAHETELFAEAMCANMDHSDIIEQWRESITISNGELGDATVTCILESGMELIKIGDSTTQIKLTIVTTFDYESGITLPLDIALLEQPLPTEGSIAWLAPAHPMAVYFSGDDAVSMNIPLWWNNGDSTAAVTLEEVVIVEPTILENLISWGTHPAAFVFYLGSIFVFALVLIRRDNAIDIDLSEDEDDEETIEEETSVHEGTSDVIEEQTPEQDEEPVKTTRKPPAKKRKMYTTTVEENMLPKKRRTSTTAAATTATSTIKSKRKRIGSVEKETPIITKRRAVAPVAKSVKTRRVKTQVLPEVDKEVEEIIEKPDVIPEKTETVESKPKAEQTEEKKKKRKPVKRKNKSSSTSKKIDENKMQKDLVSDFLTDE
jgi:WD40 repeat protein